MTPKPADYSPIAKVKRKETTISEFSPKEDIGKLTVALRTVRRWGALTIHLAPNGGVNAIVFEETLEKH